MSMDHTSAYLREPYTPLAEEIPPTELSVIGKLPEEIEGMYVRNGPNPRFAPKGRYHWFDGDAMVHGVTLREGRAHYYNRYIRTQDFIEEERAGQALFSGLMNPFDPKGPRHPDKDTANTDLTVFGGHLLSTWWLGGCPYELSLPDLNTLGPFDFAGTLQQRSVASHPKVCPRTGELIFFDYSVSKPPYMSYGVASPEGGITHFTDVELSGPRLLHDIAITENYTVLLDLPMVWDQSKYAEGKRRVLFHRDLPTRFGIIERHAPGNTIRWFELPASYIFHTINAYEEGNAIVLYACRVENPMPKSFEVTPETRARLDILELEPLLHRYRFDLENGNASIEQLDDVASEFPRMNEDYLGAQSRYSYNPRLANQPTLLFDGMIKYDLEAGTSQIHDFGANTFADEMVFVPRRGGSDEDDGYLVGFVHDISRDRSELQVLSAKDVTATPIAQLALPRRIPIGFHTTWVPGNVISN